MANLNKCLLHCTDELLWMDEIPSHHFAAMGNHCLLVFTRGLSFQGFLYGAGFRPSTVSFNSSKDCPKSQRPHFGLTLKLQAKGTQKG